MFKPNIYHTWGEHAKTKDPTIFYQQLFDPNFC